MKSAFFQRENYRYREEMSENTYLRAVAFFTLLMVAVVAIASYVSSSWELSLFGLFFSFIAAILFIVLFSLSGNPIVSFIGVTGMSASMGAMIGPSLVHYNAGAIAQALLLTGLVTATMSFLGIAFPRLFMGLGPILLAGLSLLIVFQFGHIFLLMVGYTQIVHVPLVAWAGIAIFSFYVAYDWAIAATENCTLDNAIDASGRLVLDIINLFLNILSILGNSSSSTDSGSFSSDD